jgi:NhaA family Na+:H+ antiporter
MAARRFTLDFLRTESAGGAVLAVAALAGLIVANSPLAPLYRSALDAPQTLQVGAWSETLSGLDWIKDGLMTVFFFVVGLEIKFEAVKGELSSPRRLALPVMAAVGGMAVPALVYLGVEWARGGGAADGWPIPAATDIAFALAVLSVGGRRLAPSLRTFLLALAVADDLGAVVLIATLFTHDLQWRSLGLAAAALAAMAALSRWKRAPALLWGLAAAALWGFTLHSGVSPSVAGVAAAMTIPLKPRKAGERGVLERVNDALHPYVAFGILPLFAFGAAGVPFADLSLDDVAAPATLGVVAALLVGKPLGVFGASLLAVRLKIARKPTGASWEAVLAVSVLCGIGFTMSFYLAALAFAGDPAADAQARLGVLVASLAACAIGAALLLRLDPRRAAS